MNVYVYQITDALGLGPSIVDVVAAQTEEKALWLVEGNIQPFFDYGNKADYKSGEVSILHELASDSAAIAEQLAND